MVGNIALAVGEIVLYYTKLSAGFVLRIVKSSGS
jgi:hypothetical protein